MGHGMQLSLYLSVWPCLCSGCHTSPRWLRHPHEYQGSLGNEDWLGKWPLGKCKPCSLTHLAQGIVPSPVASLNLACCLPSSQDYLF